MAIVTFYFFIQMLSSVASSASFSTPLQVPVIKNPEKCMLLFSQSHSLETHLPFQLEISYSPYQLIQTVRNLSKEDQLIFLNKIKKNPIPFIGSKTQELNSVLKLALNDPVEWDRLFLQIRDKGLTFFQVEYLITLIKESSPEVQNKILHFISKNYKTTSKLNRRSFDFSPKNSLDILLGILIPPEDFFNQSLHNPMGAYRRYIDAKKKIMMLYNKEKTYDYVDIKTILKETQELLHKENSISDPKTVTLFGSFINGTAFLETSDLDMASSHSTFSENTFNELFYALEKSRKLAAIDFIFTSTSKLGDLFGLSSPLQIRITETQILFLIFPMSQIYKNLIKK